MPGRRAADDRDRRTEFRELARKTLEALCRDGRQLLDSRRRVVGEPARPSIDRSRSATAGGRPQLVRGDHVREAERDDAFGAWLRRQPLVGVRAGQRHARFDLHELAAHLWTSLPHLAVRHALRDRRIPRTEQIGAERSIVGS